MNEPRILDEFVIDPLLGIGHVTVGELSKFGIYPYWKSQMFYSRLTSLARTRLSGVFPFNTFRDLMVESKFNLQAVSYRNVFNGNTVHSDYAIRRTNITGPPPKHIEARAVNEPDIYYDAFDGTFTVVFDATINTAKAEGTQILARDHDLAYRLKQIGEEAYRDNVHTQIGKILLAFGLYQRSNIYYEKHQTLPYQTPAPLLDALGDQFKSILQAIQTNAPSPSSDSSHANSTSPNTTDIPVAVPVASRKRKRGAKVQIVAKMSPGRNSVNHAKNADAPISAEKAPDTSRPKPLLAKRLGPKNDSKPSVKSPQTQTQTSVNAHRTKKTVSDTSRDSPVNTNNHQYVQHMINSRYVGPSQSVRFLPARTPITNPHFLSRNVWPGNPSFNNPMHGSSMPAASRAIVNNPRHHHIFYSELNNNNRR